MKEDRKKIRVGIRGAAGLLGSRLASAAARSSDLECTAGVVVRDQTLERLLERIQINPQLKRELPTRMYLDASSRDAVTALNAEQGLIRFEHIDKLALNRECDVVVDTVYPHGRNPFADQYQHFRGFILLQDGAYPEGQLIVPPLTSANPAGAKQLRMSDCILSGVVPLLYPFKDITDGVRLQVLMQFDRREADYMIMERVNTVTVRRDLADRVQNQLGDLLPQQRVRVNLVVQIPSLLHYCVTIHIQCREFLTHEQALERLGQMPHVALLPFGVTSTYDLNLARAFDDRIPPIMVVRDALEPRPGASSCFLQIVAFLYYRTVAVLPNLDAIRMLGRGLDPLQAMRQTDREMGFA
ncbi:hypothetical protein HYW17_05365 [Candidatus Uhrbacteria bacterium]|nr:hypothetical protein [Candidatus Uhrbacteria bacterium]